MLLAILPRPPITFAVGGAICRADCFFTTNTQERVMRRTNWVVFVGGVVVGAVLAVAVVSWLPRADAQQPAKPADAVGRYQVAAFGVSGYHGAYIVDSVTGEVFYTEQN